MNCGTKIVRYWLNTIPKTFRWYHKEYQAKSLQVGYCTKFLLKKSDIK